MPRPIKDRLPQDARQRAMALCREDAAAQCLLCLTWNLGLTIQECVALRREDLKDGVLRIGGRALPVDQETLALLDSRENRTGYLLAGRRQDSPITRMTASRKLRRVLDQAGLPQVTARSLREDCALRLMESLSCDEAARRLGCTPQALRALARAYGAPEPVLRKRSADAPLDPAALEAALIAEGDCLETRIIRLSWQGGLLLREMRTLSWDDLSPRIAFWTVAGRSLSIPPVIRPWLRQWRQRDGGQGYLLAGVRSGRPRGTDFLIRRASAFFFRRQIPVSTLAQLRGRWTDPGDRERLLALARDWTGEKGYFCAQQAARAMKLPPRQTEQLLRDMTEDGALVRLPGLGYSIPGAQTAKDRLERALEECRGREVTSAQLRDMTGLSNRLLYYPLREAVRRGDLFRTRQGVYRVPEREELKRCAKEGVKEA